MLRPERPIFRSSLSITKATLAIYPLSSSKDRKKNSVTMIGRKLNTLPTPLKIPSITREWITGFTFQRIRKWSTSVERAEMQLSRRSDKKLPITPKVR